MKSQGASGKLGVFFFRFSVSMPLRLPDSLELRDHLTIAAKDTDEWILTHCFYCKCCRACFINSKLLKELSRKILRQLTGT